MTPRRRRRSFGLASVLLVASACTHNGTKTPSIPPPSTPAIPSVKADDVCAMPDELAPAPRLDNLRGRIAYGRDTSEVEVLDLATGSVTEVTSRMGSDGWDFDPSVSPDGHLISYRSEHPGDAEIPVVDLRTDEDRALTHNVAADWSPAFSPDGRTIAYATDRGGFRTHVAVMPADGGRKTILARDVQGEYPTWSPDGELISFASQVGSEYDIFAVAADGGAEPVNLTDDAGHDFLPAWSPDGERIVFQSDRCPDGKRTDLYAMDADGSNVRRLTRGFAEHPAWSPDGRWLAFNSFRGLAVMAADGGEHRSLGGGTGTLPDWTAT